MLLSLSAGLLQFTRSWLTLPDLNGEKGCSHPLSAFNPGLWAVPTPFLFPAPAAAGCSHPGSTICTHCFALGHRKGSVIHSHAGHRQMLLFPSAISSFNMSVPGVDVDVAPGAVFLPVRLGSVCRHSYNLGRQQHTAQACNECTVRR